MLVSNPTIPGLMDVSHAPALKQKLNVLVIHCNYQLEGGEDNVVKEEMNLLSLGGHSVKLLSFNNSNHPILKLLVLPFNIKSFFKTRSLIRSYKPDVVHIHNLHFGASASVLYALKNAKIPFVITLHNFRLLCPSATLFHGGKLFLDSLAQRFPFIAIRKKVYKNSIWVSFWASLSVQVHYWLGTWNMPARYILLSEHAKSIFESSKLKFAKSKMVVKPNFVRPGIIENLIRSEDFLYVGRLSEEKGLLLLLRVFSRNNKPLKIAGEGPLIKEVMQYCLEYTNISYLGKLSKDIILKQMSRCTALIFPSIWYEGMPLTIIEAFASGAPIIASRMGVMKEMVTHLYNGLLFESGSEEDLAKVVDQWTTLTSHQKDFYSRHAKITFQEKYTPEKNIIELLAIYNSVICQAEK